MEKRYSKEEHEMRRESANFQRGNTAPQRAALAKALLAKEAKDKANKTADILKEAFWTDYNFLKKEGFRVYHIARKDIVVQLTWWPLTPIEWKTVLGEGQMIVTVTPTGKLNIRLNTDTWGIRYMKNNISNDDLIAELPALKKFISDGIELPPTSNFVSKDDGNGKHTPEDMNERSRNPLK